MALKITVQTPQGFKATDAYHRVESVTTPTKTRMEFMVHSYKNADAPVAFANEVYSCPYDLTAGNPIEQAYGHLKTLPVFSAAVNC
jgi:hypothetical protein